MPYLLDKKLVVTVSATALFNFEEEHEVYLKDGLNAYRQLQIERADRIAEPGSAFPFIRSLLALNDTFKEEQPIEVVLISRNHSDAGQRIMNCIRDYDLPISRAFFLAGTLPYTYMKAVNSVLYLSTNKAEVTLAVKEGYPAGLVLGTSAPKQAMEAEDQLRIAFDFDDVIADDEAEEVYANADLPLFHEHEKENREKPLNKGPLFPLLEKISSLQKLDSERLAKSNSGEKVLRVAIVTARNAPADSRLIKTLEAYDIETDELFWGCPR